MTKNSESGQDGNDGFLEAVCDLGTIEMGRYPPMHPWPPTAAYFIFRSKPDRRTHPVRTAV